MGGGYGHEQYPWRYSEEGRYPEPHLPRFYTYSGYSYAQPLRRYPEEGRYQELYPARSAATYRGYERRRSDSRAHRSERALVPNSHSEDHATEQRYKSVLRLPVHEGGYEDHVPVRQPDAEHLDGGLSAHGSDRSGDRVTHEPTAGYDLNDQHARRRRRNDDAVQEATPLVREHARLKFEGDMRIVDRIIEEERKRADRKAAEQMRHRDDRQPDLPGNRDTGADSKTYRPTPSGNRINRASTTARRPTLSSNSGNHASITARRPDLIGNRNNRASTAGHGYTLPGNRDHRTGATARRPALPRDKRARSADTSPISCPAKRPRTKH